MVTRIAIQKYISLLHRIVFYLCLMVFGTFSMFIYEIKKLKKENAEYTQELSQKIDSQRRQITSLEIDQRLRVDLIQERVKAVHKFLKSMYPGYDYQQTFDNALLSIEKEDFNKKLKEMPEDLYNAYWENSMMKMHGVKNYVKTLKNTIFPMDESTSAVVMKDYEYLTKRKYYRKDYGYVHIGFDSKSHKDSRVFAIYDMKIHSVKHTEIYGGIIEAKFEYIDESGRKSWYFVRYMHLQNIDNFVKEGEIIPKGKPIASMGNTGMFSEGYHCHIELFKWNGSNYDSINFVQNSTWNNKVYVDYKQWLFYNRK